MNLKLIETFAYSIFGNDLAEIRYERDGWYNGAFVELTVRWGDGSAWIDEVEVDYLMTALEGARYSFGYFGDGSSEGLVLCIHFGGR